MTLSDVLTNTNPIDPLVDELLGFAPSTETLETQERLSFRDFKSRIYKSYEQADHLTLIDNALADVARYIETRGAEGVGYLIISMPPRHGKTVTVSKLFPAWFLAEHPEMRVILASYGMTLAEKNSRYTRNTIKSVGFKDIYPYITLAQDSKAVDAWDLSDHEGGMDAVGVGAGVTGKGGHLIIVDDPVKSREEAESETYREKVWNWFTDDLYTRREPGGAIVVIMTRWHQDDLVGRLLQDDAPKWTVLSLPAIAEEDDPLGRDVGAALWPDRFSLDTLLDNKRTMGEYSFSALYQQRPMPAGGELFQVNKIKVIDYEPKCLRMVRFYDLAVTAKTHSDYSVGIKMGITSEQQPVILDMYRAQKQLPDVHIAIVQNAKIDGVSAPIRLEAEKAGIIQLQYLLRDPEMRGYALDKKAPEGDKYTRAQPFAARVNAEHVLMVRASWNRALLDELSVFPQGQNDDIVDACSGAWDMLSFNRASFSRTPAVNLYRRRETNL